MMQRYACSSIFSVLFSENKGLCVFYTLIVLINVLLFLLLLE